MYIRRHTYVKTHSLTTDPYSIRIPHTLLTHTHHMLEPAVGTVAVVVAEGSQQWL